MFAVIFEVAAEAGSLGRLPGAVQGPLRTGVKANRRLYRKRAVPQPPTGGPAYCRCRFGVMRRR